MNRNKIKKILITGINGSGASYLVDFTLNKYPDIEIHGLCRWHSTVNKYKNLEDTFDKIIFHECDMSDLSNVIECLDKIKPDAIFHLASYSNVKTAFIHPTSVITNNVLITLNLLEAIRILKQNPYILICSTSEVYGQVEEKDTPIKETNQLNPVNPYSVSKLTQDCLSYSYYKSYGLNIIRTRAFTYLNPKRPDIFATSFARQLFEIEIGKRNYIEHGNLDSIRTMIDVRDCMNAYWNCLLYGKIGDVYNVGGEKIMNVGNFLSYLIKWSKKDIKTLKNTNLLRPFDITLQIPDTTKLRNGTGWKPTYNFEESFEWFMNEVRNIIYKENEIN